MNYKVADVRVGMKKVDIKAITTGIVDVGGGEPGIPLDGKLWAIDNKVNEVGFKLGDRATLFWCAEGGRESNWAAGYNNRTGRFGVSPHGLNELVAPPLYAAMGVVGIFVGLFALFAAVQGSPGAILLLVICILLFVWMNSRHKKVRRAIEQALTEIKRQESGNTPDAGPGGVHI